MSRIVRWWSPGCVLLRPGLESPQSPFFRYLTPWPLEMEECPSMMWFSQIAEFTAFLDTEALFPLFGLPMTLPDEPVG